MKKILSAVIAFALISGTVVMLSSCGKDKIGNSDFKAVEEAFDQVNFVESLDKENIDTVPADNETEESDNKIYNDEKDDTAFILNKDNKKVVVTNFVIKEAYYKDIDNDGYEEVFASGYNSHRGTTAVALYDYTKSLMLDENDNFSDAMELIAEAAFEGNVNIGFFEDSDGNVHVAKKDEAGNVTEDYGIAKQNGLLLEIGDYNNLSNVSDNPDTSYFVTDNYTFSYNGKEFKPEADFAYGEENIIPPVSYIDKAAFEELTGQSYKSLGKEIDSRSIMVINGKEYVSWFTLTKTYDIEREMQNGMKTVAFSTPGFSEETTTK